MLHIYVQHKAPKKNETEKELKKFISTGTISIVGGFMFDVQQTVVAQESNMIKKKNK